MAPVTPDQLDVLSPYAAGARPDERGELEIYCPMHGDTKRSASVNVEKGVWYCHAGCGGGSVRHLVDNADRWVPADGRVQQLSPSAAPTSAVLPTIDEVEHWQRRLRRDPDAMMWLRGYRGLSQRTVRRAGIGWDGQRYKIPVFGPRRRLWNVRNYDPKPRGDRSKIWNTKGMGEARLYPYSVIARHTVGGSLLLCEGEWDTLLALQHGMDAVTHTDGAGKPWHDEWTPEFVSARVYLCNDLDDAGESSNLTAIEALSDVAEIYQCHLPYLHKENGGNDLTDYLMEFKADYRDDMLNDLINSATRRT